MKRKNNPTLSFRVAVMLLVMLLTATQTAWATDITVTYRIDVTGLKPVAHFYDAATTGHEVARWDNGLGTLWPANEGHQMSDIYRITFMPNQDLDKTNKNDDNVNASSTAFKTERQTRFTVTVGNSSYYLKSVTFKEDDTEKASLVVAPNMKEGVVTIQQNRFFNYITVELTTDRLYSVNPGNELSVTSSPSRIYNNENFYASGSPVTVAPVNANCIVEGVNGVANYDIASNKRSFSFTMPGSNANLSATLAEVHTMSVPKGISISDPYTTIDGTKYYLKGNTYALTLPDNNIFMDFTATGATSSSVATNKKSATVTVGTSDVNVNAAVAAISGTCGYKATWRMSDENNDGIYETLYIEGTGAMQNYNYDATVGFIPPWRIDFMNAITAVNIAEGITYLGTAVFAGFVNLTEVTLPSSVEKIGGQAFASCLRLTRVNIQKSDGMVYLNNRNIFDSCPLATIVVPTPELAVQYKANGNWSDYADNFRVSFGDYLFKATDEGGAAAYAITNEADLRNLSSVVNNKDGISSGKVFCQTADITLSSGSFTSIGSGGITRRFQGTYDGQGYTISRLSVGQNNMCNGVGLFGCVENATVKNVVLVSPTVRDAPRNDETYLGALIGDYRAPILVENCHVIDPTLNIKHDHSVQKLGVIVGRILSAYATVRNCYCYDNVHDYALVSGGGNLVNVSRVRKVTAGENVSIAAPDASEGFTYDGNNYYREGLELTLGYNNDVPAGFQPVFFVNGTQIDGSTYAVNSTDKDAIVTAKLGVPYLDADGNKQICTGYGLITGDETPDETGRIYLWGDWYVVNGTVNLSNTIIRDVGSIHLILCDGAKLSINSSDDSAIRVNGHDLTIYAQSTGNSMGQLEVETKNGDALFANDNINICGGNIIANKNFIYAADGNVTIRGGKINANAGIYSNRNIILGLRSATDFITASWYQAWDGTLKIADGQTLYDEQGNAYSGTLTKNYSCYIEALAGKTLRLVPTIALANDADNSTTIDSYAGKTATVQLKDRTLYKDGAWNTLCLPFSLSAEQIAANTDFAGATLMTMDVTNNNGFDVEDGTLYLSFKTATEIEAGVPYLVKWEKAADYEGNEANYDISNPVFEGMTVSSTAAQAVESTTAGLESVQMVGCYSPVSVTADDKSILFLGDANTLYYSTTDRQIRSCRAYFSVPYIKGNAGAKARAFALNFDGEDVTGILEVSADSTDVKDGVWYSLDGVRLSGKPTQRGLYINNGKKVVIK